ncbi:MULTISPECIES: hypothetical protein [unclassified Streptomyces]|uniref:hypothetical protein n=1 Tax=unclassified Streptomyces TaxID=2593676 RepID=UPI002DDBA48B|nr:MULTISPECIES: hypothetical protein [unclassified Streptomyces]WSF89353.1 hypothetical protein OIE70_43530 [Streptomyces sp. NBC_01744]WSC34481.1 hypothetical protein OHA08_02390 [Streptomyces sp. NBC_01763]WSC42896.1 hypothetical protein OIE61_02270 [Streptomyces sp. NBC_01762]WSC58248.1 hypothetical protein OG808_41960 [Streptomyces sp. NBC_01761]WSD22429.1 hypothetical protein OHA26_02305 [Streptomyces sp. NBC_01751]
MRSFVPVLALVAAALIAVTGAASPATNAAASPRSSDFGQGSVGVRLVDIPVDLADDPRARHYIVDNLTPGTTVHRRIEVLNTTDSTLHVEVYPAAATITHGSFVGAAGRKRNELSSWTRLRRRTLDVPAHDTLRDTVKIAVPRDAAPGERYAVVWAQVRGGRGGGIALVSRTGIRMYLSVGGHNPPAPNFTARTMTAERGPDGRAIVRAQITNTGGRALDLSGTLKLASVSGSLSAGPYQVQLGTSLAPHQSEPVLIPVTDEVADGPWRATLELRSGLLVKKFHAKIRFPHTQGMAPAAAVDTEASGGGALKGLVAGILLLGTALLIVANRVRRRHDGSTADADEGTTTG